MDKDSQWSTCDSGVARCQAQHQCYFWRKKFDVRFVLHEHVGLAAVNQIYVFYEAMNGCENLNCYEIVNIFY